MATELSPASPLQANAATAAFWKKTEEKFLIVNHDMTITQRLQNNFFLNNLKFKWKRVCS